MDIWRRERQSSDVWILRQPQHQKNPLGVSNPEQGPFSSTLSLFSTFSLSQRIPSLPLLFCLYDQLLWGCSNPRDLSYRGRQGPGGGRRQEVPCIIGQHLGDTWPFSGRGSQFQSLIGSSWRGRDLAPGVCFLVVSTHITWETAENADPQFLPRTTVRVHLLLPKHSATDRQIIMAEYWFEP